MNLVKKKREVVRVEGLEPPYLAAPDPKSGVSTNFTTPAVLVKSACATSPFKWGAKVVISFEKMQ